MSILASDLKFKKSDYVTLDNSTGGVIDLTTTDSDVGNDYFPDITGAERTNGLIGTSARYRKFFFKNDQPSTNSPADLELGNPKVYIKSWTPGGDYFRICAAPNLPNDASNGGILKDDTKGDRTSDAATVWKGCAMGMESMPADDTTILVQIEDFDSVNDVEPIQTGDYVAIINIASDYKEFHEVTNVSAWTPVTLGTTDYHQATITIASPGVQPSTAFPAPTTDTCGASTTDTVIEAAGGGMTADEHNEKIIRFTSGSNNGLIRRITDTTTTLLYLEYALPTAPSTGDSFQIFETAVSSYVDLSLTAPLSYSGDGIIASFNGGTNASYVKNTVGYAAGNSGNLIVDVNEITVYPEGCIDDQITFRANATVTQFTVTGTVGFGAPGAKNTNYNTAAGATLTTGTQWTVTNPDNGKIAMQFSANWDASGTAVEGDEFYINTQSSARAFWVKHVVPAGTSPHALNKWYLGASGDTV